MAKTLKNQKKGLKKALSPDTLGKPSVRAKDTIKKPKPPKPTVKKKKAPKKKVSPKSPRTVVASNKGKAVKPIKGGTVSAKNYAKAVKKTRDKSTSGKSTFGNTGKRYKF